MPLAWCLSSKIVSLRRIAEAITEKRRKYFCTEKQGVLVKVSLLGSNLKLRQKTAIIKQWHIYHLFYAGENGSVPRASFECVRDEYFFNYVLDTRPMPEFKFSHCAIPYLDYGPLSAFVTFADLFLLSKSEKIIDWSAKFFWGSRTFDTRHSLLFLSHVNSRFFKDQKSSQSGLLDLSFQCGAASDGG